MSDYQDIIDSHINGQGRQMVEQIKEHTWYDFATHLEEDETLPDSEKVKIFAKAIRIGRA